MQCDETKKKDRRLVWILSESHVAQCSRGLLAPRRFFVLCCRCVQGGGVRSGLGASDGISDWATELGMSSFQNLTTKLS